MAEDDNPVRSGIIALVAVAVVVGLLAGFAAMLGSSVLGFGDDNGSSSSASDVDAGDSLFMPDYVPTELGSGPLITLLPTGTDSASESSSSAGASESADDPAKKKRKKPKKAKGAITLSQGASEVAPGQELYLSGIYPSGEGVSLDIQVRSEGGDWADFPVDVSVSNKTFSTYVYTDKTGDLEWRVIDKSNGKASNAVKVTHG